MVAISVIVPIFNVEAFLKKCIDSILMQSFKDFELILIDDGSTDRSGEICNQYEKIDQRIRLVHQQNSGTSFARNLGSKMAKGEYITFVDADDYIAPNMLETLHKKALETKADIVSCGLIWVNEDGSSKDLEIFENETLSGKEVLRTKLNFKNKKWEWWGSPCAKIIKKSIIESTPFPIGKRYEDQYVAHLWYGLSNVVVTTKDSLYYYVMQPSSFTHSASLQDKFSYAQGFLERASYFAKDNELLESGNSYLSMATEILHLALYDAYKSKKKIDDKEVQKLYRKVALLYLKSPLIYEKKQRLKMQVDRFSLFVGMAIPRIHSWLYCRFHKKKEN